MTVLWSYLWPVLAIGLLAGALAGTIGFRRPQAKAALADRPRRRTRALLAGAAATLAATGLWHGPLGGADRFSSRVERNARATLDYFEMYEVTAGLHREPLTRRVQLAGPADDFQRSELVRIIGDQPGVSSARWRQAGGGVPLLAEAGLAAIAAFLTGLLLAYLVELRRRYNAQWSW